MVATVVKGKKADEVYEEEAGDIEDVKKGTKEKGSLNEYPKAFKKIASYSGTTRIMKCKGNCGEFDDIINIYVDVDGQFIRKDSPVMNAKGKKDVDPANVQRKDLTFWGGTPRAVTAEYRHKKPSKVVSRKGKLAMRRTKVPVGKAKSRR
jgi:hypothetical protein